MDGIPQNDRTPTKPVDFEVVSMSMQANNWKPFPVKSLPGRLARIVKAVADVTGSDPSYSATAGLAVLAGCVGNRVSARIKTGWDESCVLWCGLIGKSGEAKTPNLNLVQRPLVEIFRSDLVEYQRAIKEHDQEQQKYEIALAQWRKDQKNGASDPPLMPDKPVCPRVLTSDVTVEKIASLLKENPCGLLVSADELGAWIGSFDKYSNGAGDMQKWLSMHSAGTVIVDRKGDGTTFIERAAVSIVGGIQPNTLIRCFGQKERDSGLLARFLLCYPPDRAVQWTDAEMPAPVMQDWKSLIESLLALEPARDEHNHVQPRPLPLSAGARQRFIRWHDNHMSEMLGIDNDDVRAHHSKLKGIAGRIALLCTLVDAAGQSKPINAISDESMEQGLLLTDWFKYESRRIYSLLSESPRMRDQRLLVDLVKRLGGTATSRMIQRATSRYDNAEQVELVMQDCVSAGLGHWHMDPPGPAGGRPARRFILHNPTAIDIDTTQKPSGNRAVVSPEDSDFLKDGVTL